MAPRRGGGGSSSGGSSNSSCPGAFSSTIDQVYLANDVLFLVVMLGITLATFSLRKKTSGIGKKLLGLPFIGAVLFLLLTYICSLISRILYQCGTTGYFTVYNWSIAAGIFVHLSYWLLLFVVVYKLNMMLRQQLGQVSTVVKIALLLVVGVMGALTCAKIGMASYLDWLQAQGRYYIYRYSGLPPFTYLNFVAAWDSLYLVSVLGAGALALVTIMSLRSTRSAAGDLIGWVIALFLSMAFWIIIFIVSVALTLDHVVPELATNATLSYLINFGQALSFISILCIAKHAAWNKSAVADPIAHQDTSARVIPPQQYGYNGHANGQAYYYQQVSSTSHQGEAVNPIKA